MDKVIMGAFAVLLALVVWVISPAPKNEAVKASVIAQANAINKGIGQPIGAEATALLERRHAEYRVANAGQKATTSKSLKAGDAKPVDLGKQANCEVDSDEPRDIMPPSSDYDEDPRKNIPENEHDIRAWPVVTTGDFAVKNYVDVKSILASQTPYEIPPEDDPHPHFAKRDFKDKLQTYFDGLEDGIMPETVYVEEALPSTLISLLQIPAKTKLTMLGPHYTNDVRSWRVALGLSDDINTVFGLSYVTPDGRSARQYVKFKAVKPE
ncbi:MAG: hypothetical protein CMH52_04115 [Myxococcales bacterium]|nr:hypothetical protein [Myxococcales bacterium]|tara:strand:- start:2477 stop:3277 length:801 start_codon:yes stop_codon:yes gene_type:complete